MAEPKDQEMIEELQGDIEFDPTKKKRSRKRREQRLAEELKEDLQINETHQSKEEPIAEYAYENVCTHYRINIALTNLISARWSILRSTWSDAHRPRSREQNYYGTP